MGAAVKHAPVSGACRQERTLMTRFRAVSTSQAKLIVKSAFGLAILAVALTEAVPIYGTSQLVIIAIAAGSGAALAKIA